MSQTSSTTPLGAAFLATAVAAAVLLPVSGTHAQPRRGQAGDTQASAPAPQARVPVDPQGLSCSDLKSRLETAGELSLVVGPRGGWGDTFYGPAVPRCQFYQMPQFAFVRARDGHCGVGYICVDKVSMD